MILYTCTSSMLKLRACGRVVWSVVAPVNFRASGPIFPDNAGSKSALINYFSIIFN